MRNSLDWFELSIEFNQYNRSNHVCTFLVGKNISCFDKIKFNAEKKTTIVFEFICITIKEVKVKVHVV